MAKFDFQNAGAEIRFDNAQEVKEATPDFYAEASGELLTIKLRPYDGNPYPLPSFFHAAVHPMGHEQYDEFARRTKTFLLHLQHKWPLVRRINELWRDGNHSFLPAQCREMLPPKQYPMNSTLEMLRGVHTVNLLFLNPILDGDRFERMTSFYFDIVDTIAGRGLMELAVHFEEAGLAVQYERRLFERLEAFCSMFRYLIPVFGTRFYRPGEARAGKGVTTASFEDVKQFYLDTYEVVTDVATLVAAFNNLRHRGNYNAMLALRRDVVGLADFEVKTKASRLDYFVAGEDFDKFLDPIPDNKLRNTIGHNSYRFDGARQLLIYNPDARSNSSGAREKEFVDFLEDCWNLFLITVDLSELVYQMRKVYRLTKGDSFIGPRVFANAQRHRKRKRKKT